MNRISTIHTETDAAAAAFTRQAPLFDGLYGGQPLIRYKRERVRAQVDRHLPVESDILELNAGTGEDAIYFASRGHCVHATDLSDGMLLQLRKKAASSSYAHRITTEACSFLDLDQLQNAGPYDAVFSNFGGLNCTDKLGQVLDGLNRLVKPGGLVTLVLIPPFCIWESLYFFKGEFRTATRRWFAGRRGAKAVVEGKEFRCWYYSSRFVQKHLAPQFDVLELEGLCSFVPPSYREHFPKRYPRLLRWLQKLECRFGRSWPWRICGDYFIMTLRKRTA